MYLFYTYIYSIYRFLGKVHLSCPINIHDMHCFGITFTIFWVKNNVLSHRYQHCDLKQEKQITYNSFMYWYSNNILEAMFLNFCKKTKGCSKKKKWNLRVSLDQSDLGGLGGNIGVIIGVACNLCISANVVWPCSSNSFHLM